LISENGFALLKEVKERKDSGNSSLREIQRQLIDEGRIPEDLLLSDELSSVEETAITVAASNKLDAGMQEMERSVQETLVQFQRELTQLTTLNTMQSTILQKITDIEEMQESLRLEIRRVTFEMDLMQQRLTRRKERYARYEPRWSLNPFRWFTRSDRAAE
jgi:hypothetical protein